MHEKDEKLIRHFLDKHDEILLEWMETPYSELDKYNKLLSELDVAKGDVVHAIRKILR